MHICRYSQNIEVKMHFLPSKFSKKTRLTYNCAPYCMMTRETVVKGFMDGRDDGREGDNGVQRRRKRRKRRRRRRRRKRCYYSGTKKQTNKQGKIVLLNQLTLEG